MRLQKMHHILLAMILSYNMDAMFLAIDLYLT